MDKIAKGLGIDPSTSVFPNKDAIKGAIVYAHLKPSPLKETVLGPLRSESLLSEHYRKVEMILRNLDMKIDKILREVSAVE